jgi:hypothetical protein
MKVNIQDFLRQAGLDEAFYPGKRVVKQCLQPGEFRSHCVVYDWRNPDLIRIEIKAGLSGRDLSTEELLNYPLSFQAPTFFEIDVLKGTMAKVEKFSDAEDEEDSDGEKSKSSGSGGKKPVMKKRDNSLSILSFASAVEGSIPSAGEIINMVVMGMKIGAEAYDKVSASFFKQVSHAKIVATDLMAAAGKLVTKYTPPAFLKPKGDEQKLYKYDRVKNEAMFTGMAPG